MALAVACFSISSPAMPDSLQAGVEQLQSIIGEWRVVTEFMNSDGSVASTANGTYQFEWVVPDRVVTGRSSIPELGQSSGILFYVNEGKKIIEMISVGKDGHLWIMSGPAGGETRTTPPTPLSDGSIIQLRFTRYNVSPDRFESKMELTNDGGSTWLPGNHQVFVRKK